MSDQIKKTKSKDLEHNRVRRHPKTIGEKNRIRTRPEYNPATRESKQRTVTTKQNNWGVYKKPVHESFSKDMNETKDMLREEFNRLEQMKTGQKKFTGFRYLEAFPTEEEIKEAEKEMKQICK